MQAKILSAMELKKMECEIDEIVSRSEILDPSNPEDAETLYFYNLKLNEHIAVLESSYRKTRIKESGLQLV